MKQSPTAAADGTIVLFASRQRHLGLFVIDAVFVAIGIAILRSGPAAFGWICLVFFGSCLLVEVWQLIKPGRLIITPTELRVVGSPRRWTRDLASCTDFRGSSVGVTRMVAFDHPTDSAKQSSAISRRMVGASSMLPDTYGMDSRELADLLNNASNAARARNG